MAESLIIRVLLALTVAFWSPGQCCCGGPMPGHDDGSMAVVSRAQTSPGGMCERASGECGPAEVRAPADCCQRSTSPPPDDREASSCGCGQVSPQNQPNRDVVLPTYGGFRSILHQSPAIGPSFMSVGLGPRFDRVPREWAFVAVAARNESLFARRCLLII